MYYARAQKGSVTIMSANIESVRIIVAKAKNAIRYTPLQEPYSMLVQYDEDSHGVPSFFRKPTYRVHIFGVITSNSWWTVPSLLDTGED